MSWREMLSSNWADYLRADSGTLLVTFSPMGTPEGKFAPFKVVNDLGCAVLRFNCPNAQWYVGGIPETATIPNGIERLIDDLIDEERYSHVIVFGGSKGGFGALEVGLRIKSDVIISTGVEMLFGIPGGSARGPVPKGQISRARARMRSWRNAKREGKKQLYCIFGGEPEIDVLCASRARYALETDPIVLGKCGHSVPLFIMENGHNISNLISNLSNDGEDPFLNRNRLPIDLRSYEATVARIEAGLQVEFDKRQVIEDL